MWSTERVVASGDTVIVWLTRELLQPIVVSPGSILNTKFGNFTHAAFLGVPYGSKVPATHGKGFVHLLRPTPELWTRALPHRTQILYLPDIAFITSHLAIRRGSTVVEAGTGSASFSHSVARTVGPTGHLWSYEFHHSRYVAAQQEFTRHAIQDIVTITHRNVCKDGFTIVDQADAVFLDLPAPWDAVEHAKKALRKDRMARICCFSPCIEQVLRTVNALNEAGFTDITMYETLQRPIEVFQTPVLESVAVVADKIKKSEVKREEKRMRQIAANKVQFEAKERKRKRDELAQANPENPANDNDDYATKRVRVAAALETENEMDVDQHPATVHDSPAGPSAPSTSIPAPETLPPAASSSALSSAVVEPQEAKINVSKAFPEVRGHTSYLTFACLVPAPLGSSVSALSAANEEDHTTRGDNIAEKNSSEEAENISHDGDLTTITTQAGNGIPSLSSSDPSGGIVLGSEGS